MVFMVFMVSQNNSLANIGKQVISRYEPISVSASLAYTGMSFTLTKTSIVRVSQYYTYSTPQAIAICSGSTGNQGIYAHAEALSGVTNVYITCSTVLGAGTYYVWAKASSSATNNIALLAIQVEP